MLKSGFAFAVVLVFGSAAQADLPTPLYGTPLEVRIGPDLCQVQVWRYDLGGLPIWYGLPVNSFPNEAQCETAVRAQEDRAGIVFHLTGSNISCPKSNCGANASSLPGIDQVSRDSSVLAITLVIGGPPVHVTITDQDGIALPPGAYNWSAGLGGAGTITSDDTGYLFQAANDPGLAGTIQQIVAANDAGGTISGPQLWVNIVAQDGSPTALRYTSP
jgi:hypothetical protein